MATKFKSWSYCLFTRSADSSKSPLRSWGNTRFTVQAAASFWYQGILPFILGCDRSLVSHTSPLSVAAFLTRVPTLSLGRVHSSHTLPPSPLARAHPTCSEGCPFRGGDQHPLTHTSWRAGRVTQGLPRDGSHVDTRPQQLKHIPVPFYCWLFKFKVSEKCQIGASTKSSGHYEAKGTKRAVSSHSNRMPGTSVPG